MPEGTWQPVAIDVTREKIIARPGPDDLPGGFFSLVCADDKDRDGGGGLLQFHQAREARAIG